MSDGVSEIRGTAPPNDAEYQRFTEYYYKRTGTRFDAGKRYFVDRRIQSRMEATGRDSFQEYFALLRFEPEGEAELQCLINELTVNETYFFREEYQLRCLVGGLLDDILRRRAGKRLRIWTVPCSTGEEPYSIALYLLEYWPRLQEVDVEIVGSDIDTKALEQAREGVFGARSLQALPPSMVNKYFERLGNDRFRLDRSVREAIHFTRVNLAHRPDTATYRDFDVVFCRNLLIYFDEQSRREAADAIFDSLRPGGYVCLGHSESMARISPLFSAQRFDDAIVYQKPVV